MSHRGASRAAGTVVAVALAVVALGCGGGGGAASETPYAPPAATVGDDGWETYTNAPMVDAAAARDLNPAPDSPEAAVVKFLASRVRGDDAWREAMVASPSGRAERALAEWDEWELHRFQLRGKKPASQTTQYIKTYFEIAVDGDSDEGEDEFEVVQEAGGWRISSPPA